MVWLVLNYLANGDSIEDILAAYPSLTRDDILACFTYTAETAREHVVSIDMATDHALQT
jgi:uncharacterized protein (DUF433 family)